MDIPEPAVLRRPLGAALPICRRWEQWENGVPTLLLRWLPAFDLGISQDIGLRPRDDPPPPEAVLRRELEELAVRTCSFLESSFSMRRRHTASFWDGALFSGPGRNDIVRTVNVQTTIYGTT